MSGSGTLISDLGGGGGSSDDDLVSQILADMDSGGGGAPPPPVGTMPPAPMINAPNPNTIAPRVMDPAPPTAHIIGNDHPTQADFMAAANQASFSNWGPVAPAAAPAPPPPRPKKPIWTVVFQELRQPMFVVILFFMFQLPVVNFLFSHYIPRIVKPTGELTTVGILVKSFFAGFLFWFTQRIVAPLLSI